MDAPFALAPFDLADAEWLAHRYVEGADRVRFAYVPRARHREIPFLTEALLGKDAPTHELTADECRRNVRPGPLHFLFHSAFCGSTLLTNALDRPGAAMGLSEPVILNDMVGLRRRGAPPSAVARLGDIATRLLARPFAPGEAVVVKPSNVINPLAELLLALRPEARAVFLYAPLETFLVSVARKGLHCRLWVRELLEGYLQEGFVAPLGFGPAELFRQSDLQIAAVGWLAQHGHFAQLAGKLGPDRIATLDAERMTAAPVAAIEAVAKHYGLTLDAEEAATSSFARHSKSGEAYSPEARAADYAASRTAYGDEVSMVAAWAEKVAEVAGIALDPPSPLL